MTKSVRPTESGFWFGLQQSDRHGTTCGESPMGTLNKEKQRIQTPNESKSSAPSICDGQKKVRLWRAENGPFVTDRIRSVCDGLKTVSNPFSMLRIIRFMYRFPEPETALLRPTDPDMLDRLLSVYGRNCLLGFIIYFNTCLYFSPIEQLVLPR